MAEREREPCFVCERREREPGQILCRVCIAWARARKRGDVAPVDLMRESRIARARGLAQAISECRDDARMDGIREGAAEIAQLLDA